MGPKTERLIGALEQAISLLRELGDEYRANRVAKCKALLEQSDFRGITTVLGVFHPKSSIREVSWPSSEGSSERISADEKFQMLSGSIYDLADNIRREVERGNL